MEFFHSIWPYFRIIPIQNIPYTTLTIVKISGEEVRDVIIFRLGYVYTLIYFVRASFFIIFVFIYLLCIALELH